MYKICIVLVFLLTFTAWQQANSQNNALIIQKTDNTLSNTELISIKKITFQSSNLVLHYTTGSTGEFSFSDIRKIMFGPVSGLLLPNQNEEKIYVFPSPATDFIWLNNSAAENDLICIYSTTGQVVLRKNVLTTDRKIDIRSLKPGVYFIISNSISCKFIKL